MTSIDAINCYKVDRSIDRSKPQLQKQQQQQKHTNAHLNLASTYITHHTSQTHTHHKHTHITSKKKLREVIPLTRPHL